LIFFILNKRKVNELMIFSRVIGDLFGPKCRGRKFQPQNEQKVLSFSQTVTQ
jgi:hypothetical protein